MTPRLCTQQNGQWSLCWCSLAWPPFSQDNQETDHCQVSVRVTVAIMPLKVGWWGRNMAVVPGGCGNSWRRPVEAGGVKTEAFIASGHRRHFRKYIWQSKFHQLLHTYSVSPLRKQSRARVWVGLKGLHGFESPTDCLTPIFGEIGRKSCNHVKAFKSNPVHHISRDFGDLPKTFIFRFNRGCN